MGVRAQSFKVAATLASQRIVAAITATANSVQYPVSNQNIPFGVTIDDVKDTTSSIPVAGPGEIAKVLFNDTVTSGQLVSSDSNGRAIPFALADTTTALTLASAYLGVLVGESVAATGVVSEVYIMPGFDRE